MKKNGIKATFFVCFLSFMLTSCLLLTGYYPDGGYGYHYDDQYTYSSGTSSSSNSSSTSTSTSSSNTSSNTGSSSNSSFWNDLFNQYFGDGSSDGSSSGGNYIQPNPGTNTGGSGSTSQTVNMSQLEQDILAELNLVRRNPANYATQVMYAYRNSSQAALECYNELLKTSAMSEFIVENGLYQAAKWFVNYQGPRGEVGHESGVEGYIQPWDRMLKFGSWSGGCAENVSYGYNTARNIVLQLLIDDGVANRGHRKNILNPNAKKIGIGCGTHAKYRYMCVMDFANSYVTSNTSTGNNGGNTGNNGGNTGNTGGNPSAPGGGSVFNPIVTNPITNQSVTQLEAEILAELNWVRTNPTGYATQVMKQYKDGSAAANECYNELLNTQKMQALDMEKGLYLAAKWMVEYQGPRGELGHDTTKTGYVKAWDRMSQFGSWSGSCAENIAYGYGTAREIVVSLLIDEGVADRGHRKNILNPNAKKIGVAAGDHAKYRYMCVMDFANAYTSK